MKKFIVGILFFFVSTVIVFAESKCDYNEQAELLNKATNVKAEYEIKTELIHFVDMDAYVEHFVIEIYNVTDDFYVLIKNDYNDDSVKLRSSDATDGIISYTWDDTDTIINFTIEVYGSGSTNCVNEKFKTLYIQTPMYNPYYDREICEELTDFYLCQKYINTSIVTEDRFFEQLESYQNGLIDDNGNEVDNRTLFTKVTDFIKDNKWYFIGGCVLLLGVSGYAIMKKNKRSRGLGL